MSRAERLVPSHPGQPGCHHVSTLDSAGSATGDTPIIGDGPDTTSGELLLALAPATRRLTQLELSLGAIAPTKHISYLQTGRFNPTREMLVDLAKHLHCANVTAHRRER